MGDNERYPTSKKGHLDLEEFLMKLESATEEDRHTLIPVPTEDGVDNIVHQLAFIKQGKKTINALKIVLKEFLKSKESISHILSLTDKRHCHTPLGIASRIGNTEVVSFLLNDDYLLDNQCITASERLDLLKMGAEGKKPLWLAADQTTAESMIQCMETYMGLNVSLEPVVPDIHSAEDEAYMAIPDSVRQCLSRLARLSIMAARTSNVGVISCVLDSLTAPSRQLLLGMEDDLGNTVLVAALIHHNTEILDCISSSLMEKRNILKLLNKRNLAGLTPFLSTVKLGDVNAIKLALRQLEPNDEDGNNYRIELLTSGIESSNNFTFMSIAGQSNKTNNFRYCVNQLPDREHRLMLSAKDHTGFTPLIHAADSGHLDMVKEILEPQTQELAFELLSTTADDKGTTAIGMAVKREHTDVVKYITGFLHNVLKFIALNGNIELIKFMLRSVDETKQLKLIKYWHGFNDIPLDVSNNGTMIHLAASNGHTALIQSVFSFFKQEEILSILEIQDSDGNTPLHIAVKNGQLDCVDCLIESVGSGSFLKLALIQNKNLRTVLHGAVQQGRLDMVRSILDPLAVNEKHQLMLVKDTKLSTVLHLQTPTGIEQIAEYILSSLQGTKLHETLIAARNKAGCTTLHRTAVVGKWTLMEIIFQYVEKDRQMNLLMKRSNKQLPLQIAIMKGKCSTVCNILQQLQPEDRLGLLLEVNEFEETIVHREAEFSSDGEMMKIILESLQTDEERKILLQIENNDGYSALHICTKYRREGVFRAILESVSPTCRVELLGKHLQSHNLRRTVVHIAASEGYADIITAMIELLPDAKDSDKSLPCIENETGLTAFHLAASKGYVKVFQLLLNMLSNKEKESDLAFNLTDADGQTVMHFVADSGQVDIIRLIKRTVSSNGSERFIMLLKARDNDGCTALHCAAYSGCVDVVRCIINGVGPKTNSTNVTELLETSDDEGSSVLYKAVYQHQSDVIDYLLFFYKHRCESFYIMTSYILRDLVLHRAAYGNIEVLKWALELLRTPAEKLCLLILLERSLIPKYVKSKTFYTSLTELVNKIDPDWAPLLKDFYQLECRGTESETEENESPGATAEEVAEESTPEAGHATDESTDTGVGGLGNQRDEGSAAGVADEVKNQVNNEVAEVALHSLLRLLQSLLKEDSSQHLLRWTNVNGDTVVHIGARAGHYDFICKALHWQVCSDNYASVLKMLNKQWKSPEEVTESLRVKRKLRQALSFIGRYDLTKQPIFLIFYYTNNRLGSEREVESLKPACSAYGITTIIHKDLTRQEVLDKIENSQGNERDENFEQPSGLFVAVLSHGENGTIEALDGFLPIKEIVKRMDSPQMKGNPKVLILQSCRAIEQAEVDPRMDARGQTGSGVTDVLDKTDFFSLFATVNGGKAERNLMIPILSRCLLNAQVDKDGYVYFSDICLNVRANIKIESRSAQVSITESTNVKRICLQRVEIAAKRQRLFERALRIVNSWWVKACIWCQGPITHPAVDQ